MHRGNLNPNPPEEGDTGTERGGWRERPRLAVLHPSRAVSRERPAVATWGVEGGLQGALRKSPLLLWCYRRARVGPGVNQLSQKNHGDGTAQYDAASAMGDPASAAVSAAGDAAAGGPDPAAQSPYHLQHVVGQRAMYPSRSPPSTVRATGNWPIPDDTGRRRLLLQWSDAGNAPAGTLRSYCAPGLSGTLGNTW